MRKRDVPGITGISSIGWQSYVVNGLTWKAPYDRHLVSTTISWRIGPRPKWTRHRDFVRAYDMPDINPKSLFPTRLRLNVLLYDPAVQRYRHMRKQGRAVIVENDEQYQQILAALDLAIARVDANR